MNYVASELQVCSEALLGSFEWGLNHNEMKQLFDFMFIQDEEEERPKTNYGQRATSLGIVGKWEDTRSNLSRALSKSVSLVVTGLQTSCYKSVHMSCRQVVFALLVPSCCNKFGTSC